MAAKHAPGVDSPQGNQNGQNVCDEIALWCQAIVALNEFNAKFAAKDTGRLDDSV